MKAMTPISKYSTHVLEIYRHVYRLTRDEWSAELGISQRSYEEIISGRSKFKLVHLNALMWVLSMRNNATCPKLMSAFDTQYSINF